MATKKESICGHLTKNSLCCSTTPINASIRESDFLNIESGCINMYLVVIKDDKTKQQTENKIQKTSYLNDT